jgi:predicted PolB exonuclease-like 3'-5' exonuclease
MKKLFFDIETIPADESSIETLKVLYAKKVEKNPDYESFDEFFKKTSFDGGFGRVLCIAYAIDNHEVHVLCNEDEKKTLQQFWYVAGQIDLFVGHNIMDFDLRFILQRSIVLGVKPSWNRFQELGKKPWEMGKYLSFARYSNIPIFDTMMEWSNWGSQKIGLEHLALALGVPTPKDGIDGSQVFEFYKAGKSQEICDYCKRDVEATRAVYERMTLSGISSDELIVDIDG